MGIVNDSILGQNVSVVTTDHECPTVFARHEDALADFKRLLASHKTCMQDSGETPEERAFGGGGRDSTFWCECDAVLGLFQTTLIVEDQPQ